MEDLEMFEPVSGLEDLIGILESLFAETPVWVRLEMQEERGEIVHDHLLAQFASTFDLCDIVQSEAGEDVAIEFLFRESEEEAGGEPQAVTLPIDPQDIEVDLTPEQVTLTTGLFTLTLQRLTALTRAGR
ncbi:hypothetical protein [Tumebacillus permanentifrigoris]|uniref:Uncharacterized protein n=1 Tax=Tumebacillus permanentifrigoris TaxID=378543 RepID=A0A316D4P7_9BACL|nr:hypothetical protein [Tumebacillus permanentifrigoris]PWK06944.1 hypothetical protein C7459_1188 [Tumebacillus permanentifrigoris]